ncbi:MAG TPA: hypothetical protein VFG09_08100, partial [Thermodesulfovibrionales bacterium]|nr:hypothetical protein [Thermodesulfovibrionales bacterium]
IALCRELLESRTIVTREKDKPETWQEQLLRICGIDVTTCPSCKKGKISRSSSFRPTNAIALRNSASECF